jgi:hypothetical protein
MTKYKTVFGRIEEVTVTRETEKSVFILDRRGKECRAAKKTSWENYLDTWDQAHAHLLVKAAEEVEHARTRLERKKVSFVRIKGMKKT